MQNKTIEKIENLELIKENDGKYYINLSLVVESDLSVDRLKTKLELPINDKCIMVNSDINIYGYKNFYLNLGFGDLRCVNDKIEYENIYKKEQEMTLSDIERKLGYKIKLVSEKEQIIWKSHRNMNQDLIMI